MDVHHILYSLIKPLACFKKWPSVKTRYFLAIAVHYSELYVAVCDKLSLTSLARI